MKPRISYITLAVENLDRAFEFYHKGLGLPSNGIVGEEFENGAVAFFNLNDQLTLALWPRKSLAADNGMNVGKVDPTGFMLAHNVASETEVDVVMAQALEAGARLVKSTGPTFWGGYAGVFADPDQHLWEVVFNPQNIPQD